MKLKQMVGHDEIMKFVAGLYNGDLHAKRVLSLANATLGVLASASLAVHAIGQGLAQAMGTLSKHGIKQVDRLLSNEGSTGPPVRELDVMVLAELRRRRLHLRQGHPDCAGAGLGTARSSQTPSW